MPRVRLDGGVFGTTNNPTASVAAGVWSMKELEKYQRANLWPPPGSGIIPDTYFNRTALLLHGDGTNNANNTVFVDSSASAITLTTNGKPLQGTFSPFSQTGWSNYFDGTGDYLSIGSSANLAIGTSDFTFEFWIFFNSVPSSEIDIYESQTTGSFVVYKRGSSSGLSFRGYAGTDYLIKADASIAAGEWHHVAISRTSGTTSAYFDGVQTFSQALATNYAAPSAAYTIGGRNAGTNVLNGYISNMRLVVGTGLYSGSTINVPTSPLTAVSGTQLLTCQNNSFKDNSSNAFTVTRNNDVAVQPFSPFAPSSTYSTSAVGGSISFNGSSDYLSGSGDPFGALTGNFTVEFWVNKNDAWSASSQMIFDAGAASSMGVWVNTGSGTLRMSRSGVDAPIEYSYSTLTPNQWYHVVFVRSSATLSMYINGNRVNTVTSSASFATGTTFNIGRNTGASQYWNGYISNFRAVKGSAVYDPSQTTITVPTSPLTAVANTSLLLNATNAGIIDHTAKNVITTAAGANISTTQSKYGGSSISLSGTSTGYLQMLNTRFNNIPASIDFTLECWLYTTASSTAPNVWHNTTSQRIIAFYLSDSGFSNLDTIMGPFSYPGSNASVVRGTTDVVANTWTHVAFVRSGATITVYVNGTACGTGTSSYASLPLQLIGAISTGATTPDFYFFPGYIDDLRLTIGVARYTSNFTPLTTAFVDQ